MTGRMTPFVSIVSAGIILANLAVATHATLGYFAPLSLSVTWLYAGSFLGGLALALTLDELGEVFIGGCAMAMIAVVIFSGVLILPALLSRSPLLDVALLFAFQQSFPRFIFIGVLGSIGAVVALLVKTFSI